MMCDTLAQMYINRVEWYLIDKYDVYVSFDSDALMNIGLIQWISKTILGLFQSIILDR